jgi:predicted chitinase
VKVNPVPLPPAIDISLKDKSEDNNTIIYGSIKTSSNWISITDTKTDEFNALKQYLNPPSYTATFEITGEQLREIFCADSKGNSIPLEKCKTPSLEKCTEIANLINKYSDKFEINTPLRMAYFLGQIGTETGKFKDLSEGTCLSEERIKAVYGKVVLENGYRKYCDLFEGYEADLTSCPLKSCSPRLSSSTALTTLTVKSSYICSSTLIDYTYACRNGNSSPSTHDGSTFLGKGFIQLTGKSQYAKVSNEWNIDLDNATNQKHFDGIDINDLVNNPDIAMKASMYFWKLNDINSLCNDGINNVQEVSGLINAGNKNASASKINNLLERETYTNSAYKILNK